MSILRKIIAVITIAALLACGAAVAEDEFPMPAEAEAFEGEWMCDRASLTMYWEEAGFRTLITWSSSASEETEWEYYCYYNEEDNTVDSLPFGVRTNNVFNEDGELVSSEEIYTDGEAVFRFDDEKRLIWEDKKENAGDGMLFLKIYEDGEIGS